MNEKAVELNLKDTHFVTPHGLDEDEHYTTAYELALITDYALKIKEIEQIVKTKSYTVNIDGSGPLITTCFWGRKDGVFSCDSLTDYLALGGKFIYDVLVSGRNAINKFWVDEVGDSEDLNHLAETIYRSKLFGENCQSTIANIEFRGEEISVFFREALQDFLGIGHEG